MLEHDKAIGETLANEKTWRQTDVCCILQIAKKPNGIEAEQANKRRKLVQKKKKRKRTSNKTKVS